MCAAISAVCWDEAQYVKLSATPPMVCTFQGVTGHFTARKNAWIVELA